MKSQGGMKVPAHDFKLYKQCRNMLKYAWTEQEIYVSEGGLG